MDALVRWIKRLPGRLCVGIDLNEAGQCREPRVSIRMARPRFAALSAFLSVAKNDKPTRRSGASAARLDYIFTRNIPCSQATVMAGIVDSDHFPVAVRLKIPPLVTINAADDDNRSLRFATQLNETDWTSIRDSVHGLDVKTILESIRIRLIEHIQGRRESGRRRHPRALHKRVCTLRYLYRKTRNKRIGAKLREVKTQLRFVETNRRCVLCAHRRPVEVIVTDHGVISDGAEVAAYIAQNLLGKSEAAPPCKLRPDIEHVSPLHPMDELCDVTSPITHECVRTALQDTVQGV